MLDSEGGHLVHIDEEALAIDVVLDRVVELARHVQLHSVGEVAAVVERQAEEGVAGLEQGRVDGVVSLRAGVGLNVGVLGSEQRLGAIDRELLGDVDLLAAAVVPLPGVPLGVLVGQNRTRGLEHRLRHEVLGRDHLECALLAFQLTLENACDVGVDVAQRRILEVLGKVTHLRLSLSLSTCGNGP